MPSLADASAWLTLVTNGTLGTRFKLVPGYTSGPNMNLAMERGEIEGRGTSNPQRDVRGRRRARAGRPAAVQFPSAMGPAARTKDYPEAPLLSDLAANAEQKVVFDFVGKVASLARPIATNADVPAERVAALRRAFDATMKDPEFLAEAERQHGDQRDAGRRAAAPGRRDRQCAGADLDGAPGGGGRASLLVIAPESRLALRVASWQQPVGMHQLTRRGRQVP